MPDNFVADSFHTK